MRELQYPSYPYLTRVSWSAIFAGASVSFVLMSCLILLGLGLGLLGPQAAAGAEAFVMGLGVGGAVWWLGTGIAAFYAGGWVSGRLASTGIVSDSVIHGILSWTTASVAFLVIMTMMGAGSAGDILNAVSAGVGVSNRAVGTLGCIILACEALSSMLGARAGTRLIKLAPASDQVRRQVEPSVR